MSHIRIVFKFEFSRIIHKKSFWISTLAFPLLIAAIFGLSYFSHQASSTSTQKAAQSKFSIAIEDKSHLINPLIISRYGASIVKNKAQGISEVKSRKIDAFFYYPPNPTKQSIKIFAKDVGLVQNYKYSTVASSILKTSLAISVGSSEKMQLLQHSPKTTLTTYVGKKQAKGFGRVIVPGIFLIFFYITIVLLGNRMLTSTTEEKENRVIEMILTSIKARSLIIGKFIALTITGVIQILAILTPIVIGYIWFRSKLHIPGVNLSQISFAIGPIIVGMVVFMLGYLLFSAILIAIGSAVPTAKEAGSFFGFTIMAMLVPFYALSAIVTSPNQLIVKVLTYFPLTSPVTLLLRNAVGNLSLYNEVIGIGILFISVIFTARLALRTFNYGILEYSRKVGIKELLTRKN